MNEQEVHKAIEAYTQQHKAMPTRMKGTFAQLLPLTRLTIYTRFMGKDAIDVPLGPLYLELDPGATDWYLA